MAIYNIALFALAAIIVVQFVIIVDLVKFHRKSREKIAELQKADKKRKMDDAIKRLCGEISNDSLLLNEMQKRHWRG